MYVIMSKTMLLQKRGLNMPILDCYMSSCHTLYNDNWIECLDWAKNAGFSGVEFFQGEAGVPIENLSVERCVHIAEHAKKLGIASVAHPWVEWSQLPIDELITAYKSLVLRCAALGVTYINMHMNFISDRKQGMTRLFKATDAILPMLCEKNIVLLYENVPEYGVRDLGSEAGDFAALFRCYSADVPVKMNIDTGHAHIMHTLQPIAEDFGDRWAYTHINDNNQLKDIHLAPGDGTLDFALVANLAKQAGYTGPLLMEYNHAGLATGMSELNRTYGAEGYVLGRIAP